MAHIGFIGMGNMGYAILKGLLKARTPEELVFTDLSPERRAAVQAETLVQALPGNAETAAAADILILAVKPVVYPAVLADLKGKMKKKQIVISLAPGISVARVAEGLGSEAGNADGADGAEGKPFDRVVRIMPNTPALVGSGMTGYCCDETKFSPAELSEVEAILRSFGEAVKVEERLMDTVTTVSGSSPAFVYMFIDALSDAGVRYGLNKRDAVRMAAQTVLGSAKMVLETGEHPMALKDNVCSPGGTTIAAVAALEEAGFRNAILKGAEACYLKCRG